MSKQGGVKMRKLIKFHSKVWSPTVKKSTTLSCGKWDRNFPKLKFLTFPPPLRGTLFTIIFGAINFGANIFGGINFGEISTIHRISIETRSSKFFAVKIYRK